jgi:phosphatidylglycerophosphate synthase
VRRIALAGTRGGFGRVLVHGLHADDGLAEARAHQPGAAEGNPPRSPLRIVLIPVNIVPRPDWLRSLRETRVEPETLYVDTSLAALIETGEPDRVLSAAARCRHARELVTALREVFDEGHWRFDPAGRYPLGGSGDVAGAETWLLRSLIKPSEGFMSRHLERRISLALTRRLISTRVTPNAMTLVSVAIGLLGAPCFLSSASLVQLTGALLFLAHSILDGCDGELARLKFLESRHGALLDFWGDNTVHVAVFASMAIGWSRSLGEAWPLVLGAVAVVSTLAAAATLSPYGSESGGRDAESSWVARLTDALAHRDFIYLIVLLAAAGKAWWFLVLVAGGTPIFALLCLWAGARRPAH